MVAAAYPSAAAPILSDPFTIKVNTVISTAPEPKTPNISPTGSTPNRSRSTLP